MKKETNKFIRDLREYRGKISKQTIKTLRGQALSGDLQAARKGLEKLANRGKNYEY